MNNLSRQLGYFSKYTGWVSPNLSNVQSSSTEGALNDIVNNFQVTENHITIGQTGPVAENSSTEIKSEHLSLGRYIYLNSRNQYDEASMDSGVVMNVETLPDSSYGVTGAGFTSTTVTVDTASGLTPAQFLSVQSELNTGIYEVQSHAGNTVTINASPSEPFCKSEFTAEAANGTCRAVHVSLMRGTSDQDTIEFAYGTSSPLTYNAALYDTKDSGELGKIILSDAADQIESNNVTISIDTPTFPDIIARSITFPLLDVATPDDEVTLNEHTQTLRKKTMTHNTNNLIARGLWHSSGAGSVSTYAAGSPSVGQVLTYTGSNAATWATPGVTGSTGATITLQAGENVKLNGGKSDQSSGNISISVKFDEEKDEDDVQDEMEDPVETTQGPFPGVPTPGLGLPSIPGVGAFGAFGAVAVVALILGLAIFAVVAAAVGAFGQVQTNSITGTTGSTGPINIYSDNGVVVNGVIFGGPSGASGSVSLDPLYVDNIHERTAGGTGIRVHDHVDIVSGKQLHVNQITSVSYGYGDFVNFPYGLTTGNDAGANSDIYTRRIYERSLGQGIELKNKVYTDDELHVNGGSTLYVDYLEEETPGLHLNFGNHVVLNTVTNFDADKLLCWDDQFMVRYRTVESLVSTLAPLIGDELYEVENDSYTLSGGSASSTMGAIFSTNVRHVNMNLTQFTITLNEDVNVLTATLPNTPLWPIQGHIYLEIDGVFEECGMSFLFSGEFRLYRKDGSNFGAAATISHGITAFMTGDYRLGSMSYTKYVT